MLTVNESTIKLGLEITEIDRKMLDQDHIFSLLTSVPTLSFAHVLGELPEEHIADIAYLLSQITIVVPTELRDMQILKRMLSVAITRTIQAYVVSIQDDTVFH